MKPDERPSRQLPTLEALALQREVVADLLRSPALLRGDLEAAFVQITEAACRLLTVGRASIWLLRDDGRAIECANLYDEATEDHTRGDVLRAETAPAYFAAIHEARCIAAHDARRDPRTSEFAKDYLEPRGIMALLDAPILLHGRLVGVLCHEHVGSPRRFRPHEELIAGTLADLAAMAVSAEQATRQTAELTSLKEGLERLVEARTSELQASRESLRALFEASPVALILSRVKDQRVALANRAATDMFEVDDDPVGKEAPAFWVRGEDRAEMLRRAREQGTCDAFDAELRTAKGRRCWGSISARLIRFEGEPMLLVGVHDVTAKRRAQEILQRSEETLRAMLDAAPFPLVVTGLDDAVLSFANQKAADMFELPLADLVGRRAPDFYADPETRRAFVDMLRAQGSVDTFAAELKTRRGRTFWALLGAKVFDLDGRRVFTVAFADLTEQKAIEERLRVLATRDGLTGAFNRRHFFELAQKLLPTAERHGRPLAAAIFDLDHFKAINDQFGHAVGDEALATFSRVVRTSLREGDVFARYGGEEFALLLPETGLEAARGAADRIRRRVAEQRLEAEGASVELRVSVGVAEHVKGEPIEALLKRADAALYRAKAEGRDRVVA